MTLEVSDN